MDKEEKKVNRRDFLFTASYTVGAVGLGAVAWPLVHQMNPDKAQQALATTRTGRFREKGVWSSLMKVIQMFR